MNDHRIQKLEATQAIIFKLIFLFFCKRLLTTSLTKFNSTWNLSPILYIRIGNIFHGLLKIGHEIILRGDGQWSKILFFVKICPYKHLLFASVLPLFTYLSNLPYLTLSPTFFRWLNVPTLSLHTPCKILPICQSMYHNMPKIKYIHFSSDTHPPDPLQVLLIAVKVTTLPDIQF